MIGPTLAEIREYIETLASEGGAYYVVCGRTGERPVPVAGKRFEDRATARSAARATERYRTALRRYDPQAPYYDPVVCEETGPTTAPERPDGRRSREKEDDTLSEPVLDGAHPGSDGRGLVAFCHRVATAVFETLAEAGYGAVETAVMDAYFELAGRVADPDELCLCLLERTATELDARLEPAEQAEILAGAATRLGPVDATAEPLVATLGFLEERGLVGSYTRSPWSVDLEDGTRSVVVRLSDYALSPLQGRLPVLPVVLELYRRQPDHATPSLRVVDVEDGWRLSLVRPAEGEPDGLVSVPIS